MIRLFWYLNTPFLHSLDGTNGLCDVVFCKPNLIFDFKSYGQVENILENYSEFTKKKMNLLTKNRTNILQTLRHR